MKKLIGNLMAMISGVIIGSGTASVAGIGVEDMPESLKAKR